MNIRFTYLHISRGKLINRIKITLIWKTSSPNRITPNKIKLVTI